MLQPESKADHLPSRLPLRRLLSLVGPPVAVMALIFFLSAQPGDMEDRAWWDVLLRKIAHVTEYLLLTLVCWRALLGIIPHASAARRLGAAAGIALLYAATDEFHQTFVTGRHGTPVDVLIDAIGVAIACALAYRYAERRRRTLGPSRPSAA
jgi:VanZ family protein